MIARQWQIFKTSLLIKCKKTDLLFVQDTENIKSLTAYWVTSWQKSGLVANVPKKLPPSNSRVTFSSEEKKILAMFKNNGITIEEANELLDAATKQYKRKSLSPQQILIPKKSKR